MLKEYLFTFIISYIRLSVFLRWKIFLIQNPVGKKNKIINYYKSRELDQDSNLRF
jgi:hypothetical protein